MKSEYSILLNEFEKWLTSNDQKKITVLSKINTMKRFLVYAERFQLNIYTIGTAEAEMYRNHLKSQIDKKGKIKYKPITINNNIFYLRSFCRFLISIRKSYPTDFTNKNIEKQALSCEYKRLIADFTTWCALKGYKKSERNKRENRVIEYIEYCENHDLSIFHISIREAENYRDQISLKVNKRTNSPVTPAHVNNVIIDLQMFYRFLMESSRTMRNPFSMIDYMRTGYRLPKNIVTIPQMDSLLKNILVQTPDDYKFKVIVEVLYATGVRISEIETLCRKDIDLEQGYILIRDDKSRKDRYAPLGEYSISLLKLYLDCTNCGTEERVFLQGKPGTLNKWVNTCLKRLAKRCDIPYVSAHGIRHSIATHLLKKGADIREVQEFLGHTSVSSTEVYTRIFPDDLKDIIEKTHPRETRYRHESEHRNVVLSA